MAENTKIEWCDSTFNPWTGCTKVGPGCDHCYAEGWSKRSGIVQWGPGAERRRTSESNWKQPIKWNAEAERLGVRYRVFCASLADVFDNEVPAEWRADMFDLIAKTPNIDWLLVTKRIGNAGRMLAEGIPPNVWLGITVVNQAEADRDIPKLLQTPAAVRFLSMEPLLGQVDIRPYLEDDTFRCPECGHGFNAVDETERPRLECPLCGHDPVDENCGSLDWVIVGGESGPKARPMHPQWARDIRDQCAAAGVPFLFKQWGEWETCYQRSDGTPVFRQFDSHEQWVAKASSWVNGGICLDRNGKQMNRGADMAEARDAGNFPVTIMHKVGKKKAGRLLDGREHNGFPMQPPKGATTS